MLTDQSFWNEIIQDALLSKAEYNFLDFKLKLSENNDRLKEHINAFGNLERGGCLVFGVDNFTPKGIIDEWDEIIQKVTSIANHSQEPSLNVDVFPMAIDKQVKLLCIHVLPSKTKPVFIKDRVPFGGKACFKRTGSSTVAMPIQEIKDLLVSYQEIYFDESPVKQTSIDDLDFDRLSELLPKLSTQMPTSKQNIAMLMDLRILVGVRQRPEVSGAGWLCFAKAPQEKSEFRNSYIEFQLFKGLARDTPLRKYEIKGTLPHQIEQSMQILKQYIWLTPVIAGTKREDIPAYSDIVLREVITNSLVHRDYRRMHQPVKIAMFDNRIEIENPGGLMPGLTVYNLIHKRDWRNPLLAELMKKFGFGEMDGQGIDRLYAATLTIKVPPPVFVDQHTSFTTILSAPKAFEAFSPEEKKLMVIIMTVMFEHLDNQQIRHGFGISREKASTLIKSLVADKVLQASGQSRKYARYVLTEQFREKIFG